MIGMRLGYGWGKGRGLEGWIGFGWSWDGIRMEWGLDGVGMGSGWGWDGVQVGVGMGLRQGLGWVWDRNWI